jgi:hypothetical protein
MRAVAIIGGLAAVAVVVWPPILILLVVVASGRVFVQMRGRLAPAQAGAEAPVSLTTGDNQSGS